MSTIWPVWTFGKFLQPLTYLRVVIYLFFFFKSIIMIILVTLPFLVKTLPWSLKPLWLCLSCFLSLKMLSEFVWQVRLLIKSFHAKQVFWAWFKSCNFLAISRVTCLGKMYLNSVNHRNKRILSGPHVCQGDEPLGYMWLLFGSKYEHGYNHLGKCMWLYQVLEIIYFLKLTISENDSNLGQLQSCGKLSFNFQVIIIPYIKIPVILLRNFKKNPEK